MQKGERMSGRWGEKRENKQMWDSHLRFELGEGSFRRGGIKGCLVPSGAWWMPCLRPGCCPFLREAAERKGCRCRRLWGLQQMDSGDGGTSAKRQTGLEILKVSRAIGEVVPNPRHIQITAPAFLTERPDFSDAIILRKGASVEHVVRVNY